jgi:transcriptional activator SPT7
LEQDLEPFGEHEALVRSAFEMERFAMMENTHNNTKLARKLVRCTEKNLVQWTDRRRPGDASIYDDDVDLDSSDDEILDAFFSRKISKPKHADEDDAARANLFLPDYAITAGIPDIANIPQEYRDPTNRRQLSRKGSTDSNSDLVLDSKG